MTKFELAITGCALCYISVSVYLPPFRKELIAGAFLGLGLLALMLAVLK